MQFTVEIEVCRVCGRSLGSEYYFKCRTCGETYCWIHSNRHSKHGSSL